MSIHTCASPRLATHTCTTGQAGLISAVTVELSGNPKAFGAFEGGAKLRGDDIDAGVILSTGTVTAAADATASDVDFPPDGAGGDFVELTIRWEGWTCV